MSATPETHIQNATLSGPFSAKRLPRHWPIFTGPAVPQIATQNLRAIRDNRLIQFRGLVSFAPPIR
jgi:hypothetical protein